MIVSSTLAYDVILGNVKAYVSQNNLSIPAAYKCIICFLKLLCNIIRRHNLTLQDISKYEKKL